MSHKTRVVITVRNDVNDEVEGTSHEVIIDSHWVCDDECVLTVGKEKVTLARADLIEAARKASK